MLVSYFPWERKRHEAVFGPHLYYASSDRLLRPLVVKLLAPILPRVNGRTGARESNVERKPAICLQCVVSTDESGPCSLHHVLADRRYFRSTFVLGLEVQARSPPL